MRETTRHRLRTVLWILGGAAVGAVSYALFGCESGCPISSSPLRTVAYWAVVGGLLSGALGRDGR